MTKCEAKTVQTYMDIGEEVLEITPSQVDELLVNYEWECVLVQGSDTEWPFVLFRQRGNPNA